MSDRVMLPFQVPAAPARPYAAPTPRRRGSPRPLGASLAGWLAEAWRRHRSRQRLAEMDGRMLRDIGVTFAEAENEANKPFWRD